MFIIQLFNSLGCSLKLQRKLYAGSLEGDAPGDSCANCTANGARKTCPLARGNSDFGAYNTQLVLKSINYPLLHYEFYEVN